MITGSVQKLGNVKKEYFMNLVKFAAAGESRKLSPESPKMPFDSLVRKKCGGDLVGHAVNSVTLICLTEAY